MKASLNNDGKDIVVDWQHPNIHQDTFLSKSALLIDWENVYDLLKLT